MKTEEEIKAQANISTGAYQKGAWESGAKWMQEHWKSSMEEESGKLLDAYKKALIKNLEVHSICYKNFGSDVVPSIINAIVDLIKRGALERLEILRYPIPDKKEVNEINSSEGSMSVPPNGGAEAEIERRANEKVEEWKKNLKGKLLELQAMAIRYNDHYGDAMIDNVINLLKPSEGENQ